MSLATILALNPVSFDWRVNDPEVQSHYSLISRFADNPHSIGLVAQQVAPLVPEAIEQETVGDAEVQYYQLDYTKFIPHLIGAVKELSTKVQELLATVAGFADRLVSTEIVAVNIVADDITARNRLCLGSICVNEAQFRAVFGSGIFARMTGWLADAGNGIADLFATTVHAEVVIAAKVQTDELCVGSVCVTEAEFMALVEGADNQNTPAPEPTPELEPVDEVPAPEETPQPESIPEPEPTPQPESIPEPEPTPEPAPEA